MTDERLDLPSASSYHRLVACPGSLNLRARLPKSAEPKESEDAAIGTRIASAMAGSLNPETLPDAEREVYERLKRQRTEIITSVFGEEAPIESSEQRLWLLGKKGDKIFSGRYDYLGSSGSKAVIIDEKSGRNPVTSSESNLQLRALAVLVKSEIPTFTEIVCVVNHAWDHGKFTLVSYGKEELAQAKQELFDALYRASLGTAERYPGDHCTYCPCRDAAACPEAQGKVMVIKPESDFALATTERLVAFLNFCEEYDPATTITKAKDEAKRRLMADPDSLPGWELKPGRKIEKVTDPTGVFNHALTVGVTSEAFLKAVTVKKGELTALVKISTGQKGKLLEETVEGIFEGCTEETNAAPSLARMKLTA